MTETVDIQTGEIVPVEVGHALVETDPVAKLKMMRSLVSEVADACKGPSFHANIQGRQFPTVNWWTTVGASLDLFPYEVWSKKTKDDSENMAYESFVEIRRNGVAVTSASAMCSTGESTWRDRDEYAIKSMATTRATAKAYRLGLSFLAVMAGLEATPAEEMPRVPQSRRPQSNSRQQTTDQGHGICPDHDVPYFMAGRMTTPAHKTESGGWCNKPEERSGAHSDAAELDAQADAHLSEAGEPPRTANQAAAEAISEAQQEDREELPW